jgi:hypothetical protein
MIVALHGVTTMDCGLLTNIGMAQKTGHDALQALASSRCRTSMPATPPVSCTAAAEPEFGSVVGFLHFVAVAETGSWDAAGLEPSQMYAVRFRDGFMDELATVQHEGPVSRRTGSACWRLARSASVSSRGTHAC